MTNINVKEKSYIIMTHPDTSKSITDTSNNKFEILESSRTYILPYAMKHYYIKNGLFEANLIEWCREFCKPDKIFLDIGAHTGSYSITLSPFVKSVYAFEPQKMTYYALCGSVALSNLNNIECIKVALGSPDQIGEQTLNIISPDGGGSSILTRNHETIATETITVATLDSFNLDNIGFIKIDIEDNEYNAILGAVITLQRCNNPTIIFECNSINDKLFNLLRSIGYNIIPITYYSYMFLAVKNDL